MITPFHRPGLHTPNTITEPSISGDGRGWYAYIIGSAGRAVGVIDGAGKPLTREQVEAIAANITMLNKDSLI